MAVSLSEIRSKIDALDTRLVELLSARAKLAQQAWHAKGNARNTQGYTGFPLPGLPDKWSPCRSRSLPSTNSPPCRTSGSCASRCAHSR